jgi:hypothetical protein
LWFLCEPFCQPWQAPSRITLINIGSIKFMQGKEKPFV